MSDIESLQAYGGQIAEAAESATASAKKQHEYVNGDASTDVLTESGLVPSLAKQVVLGQAKVNSSLEEVASQMAGAMTYANTTLGLAGTNSEGYFSVPSPESSEYLILYKNTNGAALEIKRYPSSEVVERMDSGNFENLGLRMVSLSVESGYLWALVDSNNRAAFLIDLSGAVVIPKFVRMDVAEQRLSELDDLGLTAEAGFKFKSLPPETGYIWALVDDNDRIALAVTLAGKVVGNFDLPKFDDKFITSKKDLFFLGDSLTNGAGGQITWREALAALVSPRNHTNIAIGGQTSPQIAARAGAYVTLLTLADNLIPASGPVAVTARTIGLLTSQGQQSIKGLLSGVYGTVKRARDDSYTFTRDTPGVPVPVGKKLAFAPDIGTHGFDTWMIFMGANNIARPDEIKRDIAAACRDRTHG